jgi:hypothetical protein
MPSNDGDWATRESNRVTVPLLEVLIDDDSAQQTKTSRQLAHPLLRR